MSAGSYVIGFDLGTSGCKALLLDALGSVLAVADATYGTHYPAPGMREQDPEAWWKAIVTCTKKLLRDAGVAGSSVRCCGVSGHSLGVVPLDAGGGLLARRVPIWSDERAECEAAKFFEFVDERRWYMETGNGFPRHLYAAFKIMWYSSHLPDVFGRAAVFLGTKDYINHRLTGVCSTDPSYASGTGVYSLERQQYVDDYVEACGIPQRILPGIVPSSTVIGCLSRTASAELGLSTSTQIVVGGVDNACMALGAKSYCDGRWYMALGSSSWIAVSGSRPLLDLDLRPYVFAHVVPGQFTSALSMFSAGTSLQWVLNNLCPGVVEQARLLAMDPYEAALEVAKRSPVGANGLLFDPTLSGATAAAGGTSHRRGALMGLELGHGAADILRAALEGIGFDLRRVLERLRLLTPLDDEMLLVGGASRSHLWRQILADILGVRVHKTSIDQQAAALGAGAIAAVGSGLWGGFGQVDEVHEAESTSAPAPQSRNEYDGLYRLFVQASDARSDLDKALAALASRRSRSSSSDNC